MAMSFEQKGVSNIHSFLKKRHLKETTKVMSMVRELASNSEYDRTLSQKLSISIEDIIKIVKSYSMLFEIQKSDVSEYNNIVQLTDKAQRVWYGYE